MHSYSLDLKSPTKAHVMNLGTLEVIILKERYPHQLIDLLISS